MFIIYYIVFCFVLWVVLVNNPLRPSYPIRKQQTSLQGFRQLRKDFRYDKK